MKGLTEMDMYYVLAGMMIIFILVLISFIINSDEN